MHCVSRCETWRGFGWGYVDRTRPNRSLLHPWESCDRSSLAGSPRVHFSAYVFARYPCFVLAVLDAFCSILYLTYISRTIWNSWFSCLYLWNNHILICVFVVVRKMVIHSGYIFVLSLYTEKMSAPTFVYKVSRNALYTCIFCVSTTMQCISLLILYMNYSIRSLLVIICVISLLMFTWITVYVAFLL